MPLYIAIIMIFFIHCSLSYASPSLTIASFKKKSVLTNKALNALHLQHLRMDYSRAYPGVTMDYEGIRLCDLLENHSINPLHTLEFIAQDNFSVLIPAKYTLNCSDQSSIAYLVIEPEKGWPKLFNYTNTSAGPYAIIWTNPELSYISDEYWVWSVVKIVEHSSIDESIVIGPPQQTPPLRKKDILNGYNVYVSHCSSCHTINHIGQASIGPDLSQPKNIFDYYPDTQRLKQFIRDPQSVRTLANGRMSGSSYVGLNNEDLDDLIKYFKYILSAEAIG